MTCQLIKKTIPPYVLLTFLDMYCGKTHNGYEFSKQGYKRASINGGVSRLCEHLAQFYHASKRFYLLKHQTYVSFATVIRQLCRHLGVAYASHIKYIGSSYLISYRLHTSGLNEAP